MAIAAPQEDVHVADTAARTSLLVQQADSATGEALLRGLRAAGIRVLAVSTVWDAVVEMERAGGARYLLVGIDYFGRDEFRLLPLVRREWPPTVIIAYLSPGFEHLGRIAELVGADVILASVEEASAFVNSLAPGPPPEAQEAAPLPDRTPEPVAAEPPAAPVAAAAPVIEVPPRPSEVHAAAVNGQTPLAAEPLKASETAEAPPYRSPILEALARAAAPTPPPAPKASEAPPRRSPVLDALAAAVARTSSPAPRSNAQAPPRQVQPPAPPLPQDEEALDEGQVIGTTEVTEEELRLLLGEDEENQPGARP